MYNITDADTYISLNVLDVDEWLDSDDDRKTRILNVANRVLTRKFVDLVIPDNAVYEYASVLATVFSDTYKMQRYGVQSFTVKGLTFAFTGKEDELEDLIPNSAVELIEDENGVDLTKAKARVRVGRSYR